MHWMCTESKYVFYLKYAYLIMCIVNKTGTLAYGMYIFFAYGFRIFLMGNGGHTGVFWYIHGCSWQKSKHSFGAIKFLDHTSKSCKREGCKKFRRFTSRSLIYCAMKFHPVVVENRRKTRCLAHISQYFDKFSSSQIREQEVNLRIFCNPFVYIT